MNRVYKLHCSCHAIYSADHHYIYIVHFKKNNNNNKKKYCTLACRCEWLYSWLALFSSDFIIIFLEVLQGQEYVL